MYENVQEFVCLHFYVQLLQLLTPLYQFKMEKNNHCYMLLILHPNSHLYVNLVLCLESKPMLLNNFNSPYALNSFSDYFALAKYSFVYNFVFES